MKEEVAEEAVDGVASGSRGEGVGVRGSYVSWG